jgi:hypothetical protein
MYILHNVSAYENLRAIELLDLFKSKQNMAEGTELWSCLN